jgi:hypothetical protein
VLIDDRVEVALRVVAACLPWDIGTIVDLADKIMFFTWPVGILLLVGAAVVGGCCAFL